MPPVSSSIIHPAAQSALVFLGAGLGGLTRHWAIALISRLHTGDFPAGTIAVNISGCFVMGLLMGAWSRAPADGLRLLVLTGVLGGYTTFSAFGRDTIALAQAGAYAQAALYALASVLLCLLATAAGLWLAGLLR